MKTNRLEVIVPINMIIVNRLNGAKDLHADNGVDEEQEQDQHGNVGQRLKRFDKRPQQCANAYGWDF